MQTNYIVMMKPKACKVWTPAYDEYNPEIESELVLGASNFFSDIGRANNAARVLNEKNINQWMAGLGEYSRIEFKVGVLTTE